MIEICALASGSNGNCYYIGNETEAVLIDIGISYKRLLERLNIAGLEVSKIKAIFISHEHADHILGVRTTCKKIGIPAIFSQHTFSKLYSKHIPELYAFYKTGKAYTIGQLTIVPFKKKHDASDPHSFIIEQNGFNAGVFTDIGIVDTLLEQEFSKCQAVFLESNYDKEMLRNGPYPEYLKTRVASDLGHLSNNQALELVQQHSASNLKTVILSHISDKNNTTLKVLQTFAVLENKFDIKLASRETVSEVFRFALG